MAASLDKHVLNDPDVSAHVSFSLDFVGYFNDWSTSNISECSTSSGWSECFVNAHHMCGQDATGDWKTWWKYSKCMFAAQYPWQECATKWAWANSTCSSATFPGILGIVSDTCAASAGLDAGRVRSCVASGRGVRLLQASNNKTVSFPRGGAGTVHMIEPEWVEVDGPDCEATGWKGCAAAFDKTHCLDWDHCDPDLWGQHMRSVVCQKAGNAC
jgi:hypothetical protein